MHKSADTWDAQLRPESYPDGCGRRDPATGGWSNQVAGINNPKLRSPHAPWQ